MKIGLIDVDGHRWPNLCLMKLSAYHKARGDQVEWHDGRSHYDLVYMSRVFTDSIPEITAGESALTVLSGEEQGTGLTISCLMKWSIHFRITGCIRSLQELLTDFYRVAALVAVVSVSWQKKKEETPW